MPSEISCLSLSTSSTTTSTVVTDVEHLGRVVDAAGPAHLADVDQAFDAGFELHEGAVVHDVDDFALDAQPTG
jgi:hypothetical protein